MMGIKSKKILKIRIFEAGGGRVSPGLPIIEKDG